MKTMWGPCGNHMKTMWGTCANHVQTMCKPFGNHMKAMWGTCGNHMRTMWGDMCKPCANHVQTMCKPCRNHMKTMWEGSVLVVPNPKPKTKPGLPGEIWLACQHMVIKECHLQGGQYLLHKCDLHLHDLHVFA